MSASHCYCSIGKISKWLLSSTVALIVINVLYLVPPIFQNLEYLIRGEMDITTLWSEPFDLFLGAVTGVISFVAIILQLYWFYRANKNIHAFGAKEVTSPRMAVLWYFIPILNLWKTYVVAQQIWKASNPQTVMIKGTEWKNSRGSNKIKKLWILTLIYFFILIVGNLYFTYGNVWNQYMTEEQTVVNISELRRTVFYVNLINIVGIIIGIFSQMLFFQMIRQIYTWQETIGNAGPMS